MEHRVHAVHGAVQIGLIVEIADHYLDSQIVRPGQTRRTPAAPGLDQYPHRPALRDEMRDKLPPH
jgi:hypothetical protein